MAWKVTDSLSSALQNIDVTILRYKAFTIVSLSVSFERYDFTNQEIEIKILR